ncbi:mini-chromosome maintenance complex-binding protein isoform X1 [Nasonia vitripennis]|uniref:Mini-chromosome maintenance complex-binding protein n=1 Tax=Nasonia vitripennis TaxID=7425 RepID=A0A7M7G216_NASVI|nr:mini-chromosome maintenance complex-binding protein isoform X1 [Nasonia vitripennis]
MAVKPSDWTVDYFLTNEAECLRILEDVVALREIPSLESAPLDYFKDGQLVRFQGMLQDMYDPEYYFKSYQVVDTATGENSSRCGMYLDGARCQPHEHVLVNSNSNETAERQTWIVISIPGLNDWAKESSSIPKDQMVTPAESNMKERSKRSLDETHDEPMDCSEPVKKKEKVVTNDCDAGPSQSQNSETPRIVSQDHILNFPIPNKNGKACIIKVYKEYPVKLNEVIDIVGFISLDPNLSEIHDSEEMANDPECQTHHPPASIVPRLHAIKILKENNPRIPEASSIFSKAASVRDDLRMVLSQLLFGDEIAADYMICHLISSVYLRKDCLSLGVYPLNITNFPKKYASFTKDLYEILKQIIAKSHLLDITLENLNDLNLVPKKDYECNRLTSGVLQLSKNTHLVLDETNLTTGEVSTFGRQNYGVITDLIQFQKLAYDFKFYTMEYETDIPVLILSEFKSFIPCPNRVVLRPDPETVNVYPQVLEAAKQFLKDETRLNDIRQYVNSLKNAKFDFAKETAKVIQDDFVRLRQADKSFSADNLHSLMVLSRLMSLSHGLNSLEPEMWKRSLEMEMERISRLPKRN